MLFPRSHAWSRPQRWLIIGSAVAALAAAGALVYGYERYYRGPSDAAFFGVWETTLEDLTLYYEFKSDHTFFVFNSLVMDEESFLVRGRWYAGGPNMYLRHDDEHWEGGRPEIWHLVDIQPDVFRIRFFSDNAIHVYTRVHRAATSASNQAMERTATRCAFTFSIIKTFSLRAALALGGRRSSCSR